MKQLATVLTLLVFLVAAAPIPAAPPYDDFQFPQPLKMKQDIRSTWDNVQLVLEKMGYDIKSKNRPDGIILTRDDPAFAGNYSMSELKKIAVVAADYTTQYVEGEYYLEVDVQFLQPKLTVVSCLAHIRGLKRNVEGEKEWVNLKSKGVLEMRFLNELSIMVTGKRIYDKKLPYWKKSSQEIELDK